MAEEKVTEKPVEAKPVNDGSKAVPPKSSGSNKTLIIVLAIVAAIVILPIIAFSAFAFWFSRGDNAANLTEGIIESATDADINISEDGSSLNIETEEGSFSVGEQELPDDLPSAVVIYDNQEVVSVLTNTEDGTSTWTFSSETTDELEKVNDFMKSKFTENGWTLESSSTYNDTTIHNYKKDNLQAMVTVSPGFNEGKVSISYFITQEEQAQEG